MPRSGPRGLAAGRLRTGGLGADRLRTGGLGAGRLRTGEHQTEMMRKQYHFWPGEGGTDGWDVDRVRRLRPTANGGPTIGSPACARVARMGRRIHREIPGNAVRAFTRQRAELPDGSHGASFWVFGG